MSDQIILTVQIEFPKEAADFIQTKVFHQGYTGELHELKELFDTILSCKDTRLASISVDEDELGDGSCTE